MQGAVSADLDWAPLSARDLMDDRLRVIPASAPLETIVKTLADNPSRPCLVERDGQLVGVLRRETAFEALVECGNAATIGEIAWRSERIPGVKSKSNPYG